MTLDEDPIFPYGVASFEPDASSVLLWTRVASPGPVRWEVATDPEFSMVVSGGLTFPRVDPDGDEADGDGNQERTGEATALVVPGGLRPGTTYYYRFERDGHVSPAGRTRTLPSDDTPLRIGLVCCGDYSAGHFASYRALADTDVDMVIHLGDYVYADPEGDVRPVEPERDAVTRADYRRRYQQVRRDPDLQALHLRHPMITVIDDHDLADNATSTGAKGHDPDTQGEWADRLEAATSERLVWLPIRAKGPSGRRAPAQWRSVELGTLGPLVLLDTRLGGRDPHADVDEPGLHDPHRTILGGDQMLWARARLRDTSRPWALLVSSVVVNPMTIPVPGRRKVKKPFPAGYMVEDGVALNSDGWDGYPAARARLTEALRNRGFGGVILSGDVHSSWAFEGPSDDDGPVAVELTCPAVTSEPMGEMVPLVASVVEDLLSAGEEVRWADIDNHGHLVVEVGPEQLSAAWWFTDPRDPDARAELGAHWVTTPHAPRLTPGDPSEAPGVPGVFRPVLEPTVVVPATSGATRIPRSRATRAADGAPATVPVPPRPESVGASSRSRGRSLATLAVGAVVGAVVVAWARRAVGDVVAQRQG